jgi:hypothetical protein
MLSPRPPGETGPAVVRFSARMPIRTSVSLGPYLLADMAMRPNKAECRDRAVHAMLVDRRRVCLADNRT